MWNSRPPPPPFMEKNILNFHFEHWNPSLTSYSDTFPGQRYTHCDVTVYCTQSLLSFLYNQRYMSLTKSVSGL